MNATKTILYCTLALLTSGCVSQPAAESAAPAEKPSGNTRENVERSLSEIERGMSMRTWDKVQRFFSRDYSGGMSELRNSIEDGWRNERNIQLQFIVNRLNEQDGMVNAQVRWNKSWVDGAGAPQRKSGVSEFVLKPERGSYRIVKMSGDRPF